MFERRTPRLYSYGASPVAKFLVYTALSILLLIADSRLQVAQPLRQAIAATTQPLQWLMLQPVRFINEVSLYFHSINNLLENNQGMQLELLNQSEQALFSRYLENENQILRDLLDLREQTKSPSITAEVVYETATPYNNHLVISKGSIAGVQLGAPVLDSFGILGQVVRLSPLTSEVRLLTNPDQSIPVMNLRTGMRMVTHGASQTPQNSYVEVSNIANDADVTKEDILVTSGIDGFYSAGIPVAKVETVEASADLPFLRIHAKTFAQPIRARYVAVLEPTGLPGEFGPESNFDSDSSNSLILKNKVKPTSQALPKENSIRTLTKANFKIIPKTKKAF